MPNKENYGAYIAPKFAFPEKTQEAMREVIERATTDPEFRTWLLEDPRAAMEDVAGENTVHPDVEVQFVENNGAAATFILPDPADDLATLSDEELEAVAGGAASACWFITITSAGCQTIDEPEEQ